MGVMDSIKEENKIILAIVIMGVGFVALCVLSVYIWTAP